MAARDLRRPCRGRPFCAQRTGGSHHRLISNVPPGHPPVFPSLPSSSSLVTQLSLKLCFDSAENSDTHIPSKSVKQSFKDNRVTKLELGNEREVWPTIRCIVILMLVEAPGI